MKFLNWITSLLVLLLFVSAVFATDGNELDTLRAQISFEEKNYDFGDIREGINVSHVFKFRNTGNDTLKVSGVRGS